MNLLPVMLLTCQVSTLSSDPLRGVKGSSCTLKGDSIFVMTIPKGLWEPLWCPCWNSPPLPFFFLCTKPLSSSAKTVQQTAAAHTWHPIHRQCRFWRGNGQGRGVLRCSGYTENIHHSGPPPPILHPLSSAVKNMSSHTSLMPNPPPLVPTLYPPCLCLAGIPGGLSLRLPGLCVSVAVVNSID